MSEQQAIDQSIDRIERNIKKVLKPLGSFLSGTRRYLGWLTSASKASTLRFREAENHLKMFEFVVLALFLIVLVILVRR